MVLDETLSRRICSFIDNILKGATKKEIKQKIDFSFFGVRHIGLIVTAVTINGFTPVGKRKEGLRLTPSETDKFIFIKQNAAAILGVRGLLRYVCPWVSFWTNVAESENLRLWASADCKCYARATNELGADLKHKLSWPRDKWLAVSRNIFLVDTCRFCIVCLSELLVALPRESQKSNFRSTYVKYA